MVVRNPKSVERLEPRGRMKEKKEKKDSMTE